MNSKVVRVCRRVAFAEHIMGGVAGGVLSATLFYPVEAYETQLQTRQCAQKRAEKGRVRRRVDGRCRIWATVREHYTGLDMAIGSALAGYAVFFSTQAAIDGVYSGGMVYGLMRNVVSASLANVANAPFQLVKTRMLAGDNRESYEVASEMVETGGIGALWKGLWAHMLGVSTVALQFCVYEEMMKGVGEGECGMVCGMIGMIAAAVAGIATYPCVVLRSVVMVGSGGRGKIEFYTGVWPFLLRSVPPAGVLFAVMRAVEGLHRM